MRGDLRSEAGDHGITQLLAFVELVDDRVAGDDLGPQTSQRRSRAAARGHALVDERTARQLSQQEKARLATFVVRNDGSEQDLERELSAVLGKLGG
jgi:hypothetical protein